MCGAVAGIQGLCNKWGILDEILPYCSHGMSRDAFDGFLASTGRLDAGTTQTILTTENNLEIQIFRRIRIEEQNPKIKINIPCYNKIKIKFYYKALGLGNNKTFDFTSH